MHNNVLPLCCEQVVVQREHHQSAKEQAKRAQHVPHIVVVEEIKDNTILVQKKVQGIVLDVRIERAKVLDMRRESEREGRYENAAMEEGA